jgi:hypothetical protein
MRSVIIQCSKPLSPYTQVRFLRNSMAAVAKQTHRIEQEVLGHNLPPPIQIDKVAKIRGWFRPPDNSIWYPHIQAYLGGKADLDETLHKITTPIDEAIATNKLNKDIDWSDLWYSVIHSAKRLSFRDEDSFEKLVSLMKSFKERNVPAQQSGEPAYQGFPDLSMFSREAFNDSPGAGAGYTAPERSAWTSYNYFLARLTQEMLFDSSLFAIWTLNEALERNYSDNDENRHKPATRVEKFDAFVPAAAAWILGAGKALYEKDEDVDPKHARKETKLEDLKEGERLWPASARFSKERWAFWKSRFDQFSGMEEVEEETRKVASEAVETMETIERS